MNASTVVFINSLAFFLCYCFQMPRLLVQCFAIIPGSLWSVESPNLGHQGFFEASLALCG